MSYKIKYKKFVVDVLFWLHIFVILFALLMGLFVSLPLVLLFIFLHRVHLTLFKECLLSKLQKYLRGLPFDMSFLQFVGLKIFGKKITLRQSYCLDYGFVLCSTLVAVLSSF